MNLLMRAIIINVTIVVTSFWMWHIGYPLLAVIITDILLLTLANVLMFLKARNAKPK